MYNNLIIKVWTENERELTNLVKDLKDLLGEIVESIEIERKKSEVRK